MFADVIVAVCDFASGGILYYRQIVFNRGRTRGRVQGVCTPPERGPSSSYSL